MKRLFFYCEGFRSLAEQCSRSARKPLCTMYWLTMFARTVPTLEGMQPTKAHDELVHYVRSEQQAGRLTLTPPAATPLRWKLRNLLNLAGVPIALLLLTPFLLIYLPFFLIQLRWHEKNDPDIAPRIDPAPRSSTRDSGRSRCYESVQRDGQFEAGPVPPMDVDLHSLDHRLHRKSISTDGGDWRGSAPFILPGGSSSITRSGCCLPVTMMASLESYMDDFINKVGFGLNVVFGNGIGYPRTRWLLLDGAKNEQKFKYVLRRHELATEVWYKRAILD